MIISTTTLKEREVVIFMKILKGERKRIIPQADTFEMESKFNAFCEKLENEGTKYTSEFHPGVGFVITYENVRYVPETIQDEYELRGERHSCIECPYFQRPTDGRVKYTKCFVAGILRNGCDSCCEKFYEWLSAGTIELVPIGKDVPR